MGLKKRLLRAAQPLRLAILLEAGGAPSLQDLCLFALAKEERFNLELGPLLRRHRLLAHNFYHGGVVARIRRGCGSLFCLQIKIETFEDIQIRGLPYNIGNSDLWPITSIQTPTGTAFGPTKGLVVEGVGDYEDREEIASQFFLFVLTPQPLSAAFIEQLLARYLQKGAIFSLLGNSCSGQPGRLQGMVTCRGEFSLRARPYHTLKFRGEFGQSRPIDVMMLATLNEIKGVPRRLGKAIRADAAFLQGRARRWCRDLFNAQSHSEYYNQVNEQHGSPLGAFRDHGATCLCKSCILLRRSIPRPPEFAAPSGSEQIY